MSLSIPDVLGRVFAAWRTGDALYAAAHFTVGATYQEAGRDPVRGRTAIAEHFTRFFRDGPQWRFETDATIVEGERAAIVYRFSVEGPAGTWRERAGCAVVTFAGTAIEQWREYEG